MLLKPAYMHHAYASKSRHHHEVLTKVHVSIKSTLDPQCDALKFILKPVKMLYSGLSSPMAMDTQNNLDDLFNIMDSEESVDALFHRAFEELGRSRKKLDRMTTCEASIPADGELHWVLVTQGDGGVVVRGMYNRSVLLYFSMILRPLSWSWG